MKTTVGDAGWRLLYVYSRWRPYSQWDGPGTRSGKRPSFPRFHTMEKKGGVSTFPDSNCLCNQICTYTNVAVNERRFHLWIRIEVVHVRYWPKMRADRQLKARPLYVNAPIQQHCVMLWLALSVCASNMCACEHLKSLSNPLLRAACDEEHSSPGKSSAGGGGGRCDYDQAFQTHTQLWALVSINTL